ncbi:transcription factor grauzone-like [Contarinia nasturtii]|uniref:transcription factor grauzone-like n=1 Tax=Contarinia nasturtii TaxID=265458 RepID=UPI0012D3AA32|nr:transcription factor grauzone-like [Contarinia nasturtii]
MCFVIDQCILCTKTDCEIIRVFSNRGRQLKIAETLSDHFWFRVEDFNDQPNGICLECWDKVLTFDQFYKSVQMAHLYLLNSKYKDDEIEKVSVKSEHDTSEDFLSMEDITACDSTSDQDDEYIEDKSVKVKSPNKTTKDRKSATIQTKKGPPIFEEKHYSPQELEMESKIADYFQMNCDLCMHHFESWNDTRTHYLDKHNILKPFLRCCNRKFFLRSRIIEHITWHADPSAFNCTKCPKKFHEKRTLTAHALRHLEDEKRSFECHQCHKRFSRQHILNRHLSDVHPIGDQKFICNICEKNFKSEHILKMHILKVHERIDQRICDVCAKVFKTKEGFQDHMKTQHMGIEEPRVQCTHCGAWLKNRGTLNKHMKIHTDSPQVCDICHKLKPTRTALNHHKRLVHGDASFHCTICKKTFKRQLSLTEHIASHTGENLYTCHYCPKMFKSNSNMHKHRKQVHFDKWTADRESKKIALFTNP